MNVVVLFCLFLYILTATLVGMGTANQIESIFANSESFEVIKTMH